jgi:hypothetical protein
MMRRLREILGLGPPLDGLEGILTQVADRRIPIEDAAQQIRQLAAKPHIPAWHGRVFQVVGSLFALCGLCFCFHSLSFAIGTVEVPGTVIDIESGSPIVEYQVDGKRLTLRGAISSTSPRYRVGEKVGVVYRSKEPSRAQINSFTERWLFPLAFTGIGSLFAILGTCMPTLRDLLSR